MDKPKETISTPEHVETDRQILASLDDLSHQAMSKRALLEALAERIYDLSLVRGYTQAQIRNVLHACGIEKVSTKVISDLISDHQKRLDAKASSS